MKKRALASVVVLGMSSSAFAITAQSGVYAAALGGWSFASNPSTSQAQASSQTDRNYTWGGNLGYDYAFTRNWMGGVEVGYVNFGENKYTNAGNTSSGTGSISNSGVQVLATGTYVAYNGFNAFLKAGAIDEATEMDAGTQNATHFIGQRNWLPAAAIGVGYMPMQNFNVAVQYEYVFGDNWNTATTPNSSMTQQAITLNLSYKFAM